jgi:hypothetical protein
VDGAAEGANGAMARITIIWQAIDNGNAAFSAMFDRGAKHQISVALWQRCERLGNRVLRRQAQ